MKNYDATIEHKPFEKKEVDKTRPKGSHPNKNRKDRHPVTGK